MKTALTINPWVIDFKLYDEWMHPIGLYFLISLLRHNNWNVHYFNCLERDELSKNKHFTTGDFASSDFPIPFNYKGIPRKYKLYGTPVNELNEFTKTIPEPDVIFIGSGMTYWFPGLKFTVESVRKNYPNVPILIGGISSRLMPGILKTWIPGTAVYEHSLFDLDKPFPDILSGCTRDNWLPSFIDAFTLLKRLPHGPVLASLGCPFSCAYCASSVLSDKFHFRQPAHIVKEIEFLFEKFRITDAAFYDDALLYNAEKGFIPLAKEIITKNLPIRFHSPNGLHIRWITEEIIQLMKEMHFTTLRFGYESGQEQQKNVTCTKANREVVADKIRLLKRGGYNCRDIGIYVMAGLIGQRPEDVFEDMEFVSSLGVLVKPVFYSPVPKTKLFDEYAEKYPQILTDPLTHNDMFFITQLKGWNWETCERIRAKAKELNRRNC